MATYTFCALYCAVILVRVSSDIGRQQEVFFFRLLLVALLVYCVVESVWAVGNFGYSQAINRFNLPLTIANSILVNALCYLWFCYMESYLRSQVADRKILQFLSFIPFGVSVLLSVSSLWTGWVFFIEPDGSAGRGPLYLVMVGLAYVYAIVATLRSAIGAATATERHRRIELLVMSLFVIPPAAVGVIDTIFPMMPIIAPAFFFSFLIVFTMLQDSQVSNDSLTGLNNRRRAERYLGEALSGASKFNPVLFFFLDGDSFKQVNDTYGHLEGDRALQVIADALRDSCRNTKSLAARWGGDEFVVIAQEKEVGSAEDFANMVENCLLYECSERHLPYKLTVTIGHARCIDPKQSQRSLIAEADRSLYEKKRLLHQREQ